MATLPFRSCDILTMQESGRGRVRRLSSGGQKKWQTFFAKRNLGGNFLNCYHPVRAPPRDKQSLNLCGIDNASLLIYYYSILYSNASKIRLFTRSSEIAV